MTLRNLENDLVQLLTAAMPDVQVMHGQYGSLNIIPPAVMVYVEPAMADEAGIYRAANVILAACAASGDATQSKFDALELLEQAMAVLTMPPRTTPVFDGFYDNIAIAIVEYTIPLR